MDSGFWSSDPSHQALSIKGYMICFTVSLSRAFIYNIIPFCLNLFETVRIAWLLLTPNLGGKMGYDDWYSCPKYGPIMLSFLLKVALNYWDLQCLFSPLPNTCEWFSPLFYLFIFYIQYVLKACKCHWNSLESSRSCCTITADLLQHKNTIWNTKLFETFFLFFLLTMHEQENIFV